MRIISGIFKWKKIDFLSSATTRPLKDSVKENIFNILAHSNFIRVKVEYAKVLDLYSGIGSFGLECLSRKARKVTFVEQDNKALSVLKKNLKYLHLNSRFEIVKENVEKFVQISISEKYTIFFFDPPFSDNRLLKILIRIKENKAYEKNHIIIIHREKKSKDDFNSILKNKFEKSYGRSKIIFGTFT